MGVYFTKRLCLIPFLLTVISFILYAIPLRRTHLLGAPNSHWIGEVRQEDDGHTMCDLKQFNEKTRLTDGHPVIPRQYLAGCTRFIYNRVPKCASRTMKDVFAHRGQTNNFTTIFIDRAYSIDIQESVEYQREMNNVTNARFILVSHHYLYNFSSLYPYPLIYVNIVREPSSWFQSVFNFHKYTSYGADWWKDDVVGGCARKDECFERVRTGWGPLKFLCGQSHSCNANTLEVLQRVKGNIDRLYLLVGVIEQLPEFSEVLEYLVPGMFNGLTQSFVATHETLFNDTKTPQADLISEEDLRTIHDQMTFENDLYAFVKQRFNTLLKAVRTSKVQNGLA